MSPGSQGAINAQIQTTVKFTLHFEHLISMSGMIHKVTFNAVTLKRNILYYKINLFVTDKIRAEAGLTKITAKTLL